MLQFKSLGDLALELNSNHTQNSHQGKFNLENLGHSISNGIKLKSSNAKMINAQKHNDENTKSELLALFKKQKDILEKRLEIKKKIFENFKSKQKVIFYSKTLDQILLLRQSFKDLIIFWSSFFYLEIFDC